jgi:acyl carrier protein
MQLWIDLLGGEVGLDDDFFDLGGDSLAAVQLVERILEETGTDLPISAMFDYPTARKLAAHMSSPGARP